MIGSFRLPICVTSSGDTTAPTILTATVEDANPNKLVVVFSEVVTITSHTGLTIEGAVTPTFISNTGSGTNTITFTLSTALTNGQSVTLNVASSNTIKDAANNALAATTEAITNNVAAVAATMPREANLIRFYKLNETTGDAIDETGTQDGVVYGGMTRDGSAYTGNGTNAYIDGGNTSETTKYSIAIRLTTGADINTGVVIISKYNSTTDRSIYFYINGGLLC